MSQLIQFIDSGASMALPILLSALAGSSVIVLLVFIFIKSFRVKAPVTRYYLWLYALSSIVAIPLVSPFLPEVSLPSRWAPHLDRKLLSSNHVSFTEVEPDRAASVRSRDVARSEIGVTPSFNSPSSEEVAPGSSSTSVSVWSMLRAYGPRTLFLSWIVGVSIIAICTMSSYKNLVSLKRSSSRVSEGEVFDLFRSLKLKMNIRGRIDLWLSRSAQMPIAGGILRGYIILPQNLVRALSSNELRTVIAHELAHIKRCDCLVNIYQRICEAVFFFSPMTWLASWKLAIEREHVCDDWVIRVTGEKKAYAESLISAIEGMKAAPIKLPLATAAAHRESHISRRITMILDDTRSVVTGMSWKAFVLIVALVFISLPILSIVKAESGAKDSQKDSASSEEAGEQSSVISIAQAGNGVMTEKSVGESYKVAGKIINKSGEPVPGAKVYSYVMRDWGAGENQVEAETSSARDGSFTVDGLKPLDQAERYFILDHVERDFIVVAPGYAIGWEKENEIKDRENIIIRLEPPETIKGRIIDEKGNAIVGAIVNPYIQFLDKRDSRYKYLSLPDSAGFTTIVSDEEGNFVLANLPKGARVDLRIKHEKYAKKNIYSLAGALAITTGAEDLEFTLFPSAFIRGRVTYAGGDTGVSRIRVECRGVNNRLLWGYATTDANGDYSISNLELGIYNVYVNPASLKKLEDWTALPRRFIKVSEGSTLDGIDLQLTEGMLITGSVTYASTGEPVEGVQVTFSMEDLEPHKYYAQTKEDGMYHLRVPRGKGMVYIYARDKGYPYPPHHSVQEVGARDVNFHIRSWPKISGLITDPDGVPVEGAYVYLPHLNGESEKVVSGKDGRFVLLLRGYKAEDKGALLRVEHADRKLGNIIYITQGWLGTHDYIEMPLFKLASIKGSVFDRDGNPVRNAKVSVDLNVWIEGARFGMVLSDKGTTDADGHYEIKTLPAGLPYNFNAEATGYGEDQSRSVVKPPPDEDCEADFVLERADSFISGRVTDVNGQPIFGAIVDTQDSGHRITRTDHKGHYRLEGLIPGKEIDVSVYHGSYGRKRFGGILTGTADQNFVLSRQKKAKADTHETKKSPRRQLQQR